MDRRQRKRAEVGQQKCCPPIHPLSGYHSKAVVAATQVCKDSPPLLRVKRGCAAHAPAQMCTFLLNRIALYTGRLTRPQCPPGTGRATGPFHSLFPLVAFRTAPQPHKNLTHLKSREQQQQSFRPSVGCPPK